MDGQDKQDGNDFDLVKRLNSSVGLAKLMNRPMVMQVALRSLVFGAL